VVPGAATLFFVNQDGWALTCGHVGLQIATTDTVNQKYGAFLAEVAQGKAQKRSKQTLNSIARRYEYATNPLCQLKIHFMDCIEGLLDFEIRFHDKLDVALIHFRQFTTLKCDSFPVFPFEGSSPQPGASICRLGFPFPEFTNFRYDTAADSIEWTSTGRSNSPVFPIDGMLTRQVVDPQLGVVGFELTTPGLRGQSGGPAFDVDGRVCGMQSGTTSLDLAFDVDATVMRNGSKVPVKDYAFLHVGRCVHVDVLRAFMKSNSVAFQEG
jgi:hypothetical protein